MISINEDLEDGNDTSVVSVKKYEIPTFKLLHTEDMSVGKIKRNYKRLRSLVVTKLQKSYPKLMCTKDKQLFVLFSDKTNGFVVYTNKSYLYDFCEYREDWIMDNFILCDVGCTVDWSDNDFNIF